MNTTNYSAKAGGFTFKDFKVVYHGRDLNKTLIEFVQKHHYKKSARSMKQRHIFSLWYEDLLCGVAIYGQPCGRTVENKHGLGTLELRRFCLINEAPFNSETWFLSRTVKFLKGQHVPKLISFADTNRGHEGTIYKASSWEFIGQEEYRQQILKIGRRSVSMREVYQKSKDGSYKPAALKYQQLKAEGKAKAILTKAKNIYIFNLDK